MPPAPEGSREGSRVASGPDPALAFRAAPGSVLYGQLTGVEARVGELVPFSHDRAFRLRPTPVALSGSIGSIGAIVAVIAGLLVLTDFLSFIRENSYHVCSNGCKANHP